MRVQRLPHQAIVKLPPLIQALLDDSPAIRSLHSGRGELDNLLHRQNQRSIPNEQRAVLANAMRRRYASVQEAVDRNLDRLAQPEATTIATGHQLVVGTGPFYMLNKIASTIVLAREVELASGKPVIPVFWMASEDHDFEEIATFFLGDLALSWEAPAGGPVGRMPIDSLRSQWEGWLRDPALEPWHQGLAAFQPDPDARTWAEAFHRLIDRLFGHHGLLILDGDDPQLKACFAPWMARELESSFAESPVKAASEMLVELGYKPQVNPRSINLFHITDQTRVRLERTVDGIQTVDGAKQWSEDAWREALIRGPEAFSPNVILRPMYQEVLLPNLAYVGGPGELSYWLQLKAAFEVADIPFPLLRLRHSTVVMSPGMARKFEKLSLPWSVLCGDVHTAERALATRVPLPDLSGLRRTLEEGFDTALVALKSFDPNLERPALGEKAKWEKGLEQLEKKVLRSAKQRSEAALGQLHFLRNGLFPGGIFQERRANVLALETAIGVPLAEALVANLDPKVYDTHIFWPEAD